VAYDEVLRAELTPALHRRGVTQEVELAYNHKLTIPLRLTRAMYMTHSRLGLADSLERAAATFEAHSRPSVASLSGPFWHAAVWASFLLEGCHLLQDGRFHGLWPSYRRPP
jgi:hypothetical protein